MTELQTKPFGKIEINPRQIIQFPEGLFGFHDYREFALIEESPESPFKWLQSTVESSLAFIVIQPELFMKTPYEPEISRGDIELLETDNLSECLIFVIVTIPESSPEKMTANLQGPVLIHPEKKIGRQVISNNDRHPVRAMILDQMET